MSKEILASMAWRRAAKHFLPPLRPIDISPILNAALLAPTSFGIQPFQIYVVSSAEMKKKIQPAAYNQPQITECSHLLIFAAKSNASATVERFLQSHGLDQKYPEYSQSIRGSMSGMDSPTFLQWSMNQTHIALGFSLLAAADLRIGSCPMGGFDAKAMSAVLNLPENETVAVLMAVGVVPTTGEDEKKANPFPKLNMKIEELVTFLDK